MERDPRTTGRGRSGGPSGAAPARRLAAVVAGHRGDGARALAALDDPDPTVPAAALGALARLGRLEPEVLVCGLGDPTPPVRRRAAELGGTCGLVGAAGAELTAALVTALGDRDPLVAEAACWALGERDPDDGVLAAVAAVARQHPDARCREAAVGALGSFGSVGRRDALEPVLEALDDRPPIRRRATVALAAFDGPEVDDALRRSATDRDWQVREVAEILLDEDDSALGGGEQRS